MNALYICQLCKNKSYPMFKNVKPLKICGLKVKMNHVCGMYMEHHSSTGTVNLNTELQLNSIFRLDLLRLFLLNTNLLNFS